MPNIKSAKKRVLVNQKKTEQNKNILSAVKTEIKKIEALVKENKIEDAKALLPHAFALIDSAASKNIIHANNAANKKARLAKKLNGGAVIKEEVKPAAKKAKKAAEEVKPAEDVKPVETAAEKPAEDAPKKTAARKPRAKKADAEEVKPTEDAPKKTATRKPRAKKADAEKSE